jgi:putative membrane protein insertion efficiency factor
MVVQRISKVLVKLLIGVIKLYQITLSPFKTPSCIFYPTCSNYAIMSLKEFGIIKGLYFTFCRIIKCHPFHPGGYDPVQKGK